MAPHQLFNASKQSAEKCGIGIFGNDGVIHSDLLMFAGRKCR
jgi:hypothetical protein